MMMVISIDEGILAADELNADLDHGAGQMLVAAGS